MCPEIDSNSGTSMATRLVTAVSLDVTIFFWMFAFCCTSNAVLSTMFSTSALLDFCGSQAAGCIFRSLSERFRIGNLDTGKIQSETLLLKNRKTARVAKGVKRLVDAGSFVSWVKVTIPSAIFVLDCSTTNHIFTYSPTIFSRSLWEYAKRVCDSSVWAVSVMGHFGLGTFRSRHIST